jgi:hypothetical protein
MQFDVFISYSKRDKATADAACAALEAAGIRYWIAPRDILPGADWGAAIIDALDNCRAMVLIFSSSANSSPQIRREVERVVGRGLPVIPVRIEDSTPTKAMAYFMGPVHWLDAMTPPLEHHLQKLADSLKTLLTAEQPQAIVTAPPVAAAIVAATPPANSADGAAVKAAPADGGPGVARTRLIAMKCAVLLSVAIGVLLSIGTVIGHLINWLPATAALAFISYWLIYRNLTKQPATARIAAFCCGLIWAYFAVWNASVDILSLVAIEGFTAACLIFVALELSRVK